MERPAQVLPLASPGLPSSVEPSSAGQPASIERPAAVDAAPFARPAPDPPAAAHETADWLHSAAIHLLRRLRREDEASGLSAPRLSALSVIVFGGPLTLGALAAAEQVRPPTITRLVATLEADGLVQRETSAVDRRSVLVRATPAGTQLLHAGRRRRTDSLASRLATLSPEDLATLRRATGIMEGVIRELA